jgi:hypothetical protein
MSIIKIWKAKNQIFEGIKNKIFKKEHIEEIATERHNICNKCPFLDKKGDKCYVKGTQPCCSLCGCDLSLKTRALSAACDDNKWDAVLSEEEDDKLLENLDES